MATELELQRRIVELTAERDALAAELAGLKVEQLAGVMPQDLQFPLGDVRRYGAKFDDSVPTKDFKYQDGRILNAASAQMRGIAIGASTSYVIQSNNLGGKRNNE